jgi:exonuclease SbcD
MHIIDEKAVSSRFIETPARIMRTFKPEGLPDTALLESVMEGEYVRIVYTVKEEDVARVDEASLVRLAYEKGAAHVKIDKTVIPVTNVRAEGISRLASLEEKLKRWGELNGQPITEGLLGKLHLLRTADEETILSDYLKKERPDETAVFAA